MLSWGPVPRHEEKGGKVKQYRSILPFPYIFLFLAQVLDRVPDDAGTYLLDLLNS